MEPLLEVIEQNRFMENITIDSIFHEFKPVFESSEVGISVEEETDQKFIAQI